MLTFPRELRLIDKHDFQSVFAKPHKATRNYLIALYIPNHLAQARLGMIINKHKVKRAVDRNALRRSIRESFRQHQLVLNGLDIIILIRSDWIKFNQKGRNKQDDINSLWQVILKQSSPAA